jgi:hypothetical protein
MNAPYVAPVFQRTLLAVFQFYDAFFDASDDRTLAITSPLEVSIPNLGWIAFRADDFTYRFSARTLTQSAPGGSQLTVQVVAPGGDYVSFEKITLPALPLPPPNPPRPPRRGDFVFQLPLWPTLAVRPPGGETAVHGYIWNNTAQPLAAVKVEMWPGAAPAPPPNTPYTLSNASGDFLYRFPLLKGTPGDARAMNIRLNGGAVSVLPNSLNIVLGQTQIVHLKGT